MSGPRTRRHDSRVVQALTVRRPLSRSSPRMATSDRPTALPSRWLALGLITRAAAATTAVALLAVHHVTDFDGTLIVVVIGYTALTSFAVMRVPGVVLRPAAWCFDIAAILVLVTLSGDWRSPFYLLSLTTLAAPGGLSRHPGRAFVGVAYALTYALIAALRRTRSLRSRVAVHGWRRSPRTSLLPVLVASASATRPRRSRRLHGRAAPGASGWPSRPSAGGSPGSCTTRPSSGSTPPTCSSAPSRAGADATTARAVGQALYELESAAADMDTSLAELRSPLEGRPLDEALRERATELRLPNGPVISVVGAHTAAVSAASPRTPIGSPERR